MHGIFKRRRYRLTGTENFFAEAITCSSPFISHWAITYNNDLTKLPLGSEWASLMLLSLSGSEQTRWVFILDQFLRFLTAAVVVVDAGRSRCRRCNGHKKFFCRRENYFPTVHLTESLPTTIPQKLPLDTGWPSDKLWPQSYCERTRRVFVLIHLCLLSNSS